ncbi:MAG: hypothetical protein ACXWQO_08750 [Bdellovibrionota bacterium]
MKILLIAVMLLAGFGTNGFTATKAKEAHKMEMMNLTPAQREDMAKAHEAMAACLRSTKPLMDCHKEMMASCKDKLGKSCPMMGHMHGHEMMEHEEKNEK